MTAASEDTGLFDLVIIGGGINGAGIAADAAARGLRVALLEEQDFSGGTSSASSKLSHGGLRYLEQFEFRLVREALGEREVLLKKAPHLVWPLRFALPVMKGMRPAWMIRIGLFLYDTLARRDTLPGTKTVNLRTQPGHMGFKETLKTAFLYSDCWVDDARLVIANLLMAQQHGAQIFSRTRFLSATRKDGLWQITAKGKDHVILNARAVINAAGPWVEGVSDALSIRARDFAIRHVKGSHIVTRKLYEGDNACLIQLPDGRILVIMPYEGEYTLIGTTDIEVHGEFRGIQISQGEIDYLLGAVNQYFQRQLTEGDVVWSYAGVRPLYEDAAQDEANPSKVTRDYAFRVDDQNGTAPVLTILGGKLTTYRKLAEHALAGLDKYFPDLPLGKTATSPLPGGQLGQGGQAGFVRRLGKDFPWLPGKTAMRFTRLYGSRSYDLIGQATSFSDLGKVFGADLTLREVTFLCDTEWAVTAEDILWRRTKLGLKFGPAEVDDLTNHLAEIRQEKERRYASA